jgi:hypothetical protein
VERYFIRRVTTFFADATRSVRRNVIKLGDGADFFKDDATSLIDWRSSCRIFVARSGIGANYERCWSDVAVVALVEVVRTCKESFMPEADVIAGDVVRCANSNFSNVSKGCEDVNKLTLSL